MTEKKPETKLDRRSPLLFFFFIVQIATAAYFPPYGLAQEYAPIRADSGLQLGMEIELVGPRTMQNLLSNFDVVVPNRRIEALVISEALKTQDIDDYLNVNSLTTLPQATQDFLLAGQPLTANVALTAPTLKTESKPFAQGEKPPSTIAEVGKPSEQRSRGGILLPEGYDVEKGRRAILLSEGAPKSSEPPRELAISESNKSEKRWQEILNRWKSLNIEERRAMVTLNGLPPLKKATLLHQGAIQTEWLKPKSDLAPDVRELFSRLEWNRDGSVVEFRHKVPVQGTENYVKDVERFSDLVGIRRYIDDPSKPQLDALEYSYHMHASHPKAKLNKIAPLLNVARLFDLQNEGRGTAALEKPYGFQDVKGKGLIKLVNDQHIEVRTAIESPRVEAEKIKVTLQQSEDEAVKILRSKIENDMVRVKDELVQLGQQGLKEADPMRRAALARQVTTAFEVLGSVDFKRFTLADLETVVAKTSKAEAAAILKQLSNLNQSNFGVRLFLPLMRAEDIRKDFVKIARSYADHGQSLSMVNDLRKKGIGEREMAGRLGQDAEEIFRLGTEKPEATERFIHENRRIFIRTLPDSMHQHVWTEVVGKARNVDVLDHVVAGWVPSVNMPQLERDNVAVSKLIEQKLFELSPDPQNYLERASELQTFRSGVGFTERFREDVLKRVRTLKEIDLTKMSGMWLIPGMTKEDIPRLQLLSRATGSSRIGIRLHQLGAPLDQEFLKALRGYEFMNFVPTLQKVMDGPDIDEKMKILNLVRDAKQFDQYMSQGFVERLPQRQLFKTIAVELTRLPNPTDDDIRAFRDILRIEQGLPQPPAHLQSIVDAVSETPAGSRWRMVLRSESRLAGSTLKPLLPKREALTCASRFRTLGTPRK